MTPHTRITTPFNRDSTADEVLAGLDLTGRRAIVTEGASGVGAETARALASAGAEVTLAVRNTQAGERAAVDMRLSTGNGSIVVAPLDLTNRASIAAFTAAWRGPVHVLVNNAEHVTSSELTRAGKDWEIQFAANHLGHFELALGLHEGLAAAGQARVV